MPTDFSECAQVAVDVASALGKTLQAEVLFLHFFPDPGRSLHLNLSESHNYSMTHPDIGHVKGSLDELVRRTESMRVTAKDVLVYDRGSDSIEDYADSYRADLIVMGTHGVNGLVEWFAGSNAQRVARNSTVPVLTLKQFPGRTGIKNILFASSFEENVVKPMLFITELAKIWNSTIHLLYINLAIHSTNQLEAEEKMKDIIAKFPENNFTVNFSRTNDEEYAISKAAHELDADLVSLTPYARDGVIRFFSHSIAENLVNHEPLPVLVLPE